MGASTRGSVLAGDPCRRQRPQGRGVLAALGRIATEFVSCCRRLRHGVEQFRDVDGESLRKDQRRLQRVRETVDDFWVCRHRGSPRVGIRDRFLHDRGTVTDPHEEKSGAAPTAAGGPARSVSGFLARAATPGLRARRRPMTGGACGAIRPMPAARNASEVGCNPVANIKRTS